MIIGINGQKRSGKDTIAEYLHNNDPDNVVIYKYAQPIKEGLLIELSKYGYEFKDIDGQDGFNREEKIFSFDESIEILLTACEYCNVNADYSYAYFTLLEYPDTHFSIRMLMQILGTDIARSLNDTHWIEYAEEKYSNAVFNNPEVTFIITDVRFPNEMEVVTKRNGIMIQVHRDNDVEGSHASDTSIGYINDAIHIDNNGSLNELYEQIENKIGILK